MSDDYSPVYSAMIAQDQKIAALTSRAEAAEAQVAALRGALKKHHDWHLNAGEIGLPDGKGGWIETDNAANYSDSVMCDETMAALGIPPCKTCKGRGYVVEDAEWKPVAIKCPDCKALSSLPAFPATEKLQARVKELEEVVQPFAKIAARWPYKNQLDNLRLLVMAAVDGSNSDFTLEQVCRAASTLKGER